MTLDIIVIILFIVVVSIIIWLNFTNSTKYDTFSTQTPLSTHLSAPPETLLETNICPSPRSNCSSNITSTTPNTQSDATIVEYDNYICHKKTLYDPQKNDKTDNIGDKNINKLKFSRSY